MVWSGGEVHLCSRRCGGVTIACADISGADRPNAVDGQWLPAGILQQSIKVSSS